MAINNFKPFALDPNANVTSQADWEALPALLSGFTAGKASSAQVNKAIRQASFIAAALAQYTANKSRLDVLDDGDLNGFISKMGTAFGKDFQALDATLSALAGLATGANKLPYFTGNDTAAQTDLTSVGRDIIGKNTIADILTYLGLGEAAKRNVGTGANQIPDMSLFASSNTATAAAQKFPSGLILQCGQL
ncbi:phage tail protein, partial [Shigella flexneri]